MRSSPTSNAANETRTEEHGVDRRQESPRRVKVRPRGWQIVHFNGHDCEVEVRHDLIPEIPFALADGKHFVLRLTRQRELLPPTGDAAERERYPTAGDSAAFRAWIAEVVKPMIEARYRHDGTSFLVGESAAGHFVVETWADAPGLFTGYAAISPSLQWDFEALSQHPLGAATRPPIYLSLADEGGATESGMLRLLDALPADQPYCFSDRRTQLVHANSLHGLLPEALQYLMPTDADWLEEFGMVLRCEKRGG